MQRGEQKQSLSLYEEAVFQSVKRTMPDIRCPSNHKIAWACINPDCLVSLRCSNPLCLNCKQSIHEGCPHPVSTEQLTVLLNAKVKTWAHSMLDAFRAEDVLIRKIHRGRRQFLEKFVSLKISSSNLGVFDNIKRRKTISGRQAGQMVLSLRREEEVTEDFEDRKKTFIGQIERYSMRISKLREGCFLPRKKLKNELPIESKVLVMKGSIEKDSEQIKRSLCQPSAMQLVFRASDNNFRAKAFHEACDEVSDTLVVARTEFGKTIAGYSHYKWGKEQEAKANKQTGEVSDGERRAFLLHLDQGLRLVPHSSQRVIISNQEWGPIFGAGDLGICDQCNIKPNSTVFGIGGNYNVEKEQKYDHRTQEAWRAICGASKGYKFKVVEYEVFQIQWEDKNRKQFEAAIKETREAVGKVDSSLVGEEGKVDETSGNRANTVGKSVGRRQGLNCQPM